MSGCKAPTKSNQVTIGFIKDPSTLDPARAHDLASTSLCYFLYEGLFRYGEDGFVENGLCQNYSISSDGLTYEFILKPSFWSDGSKIKASDFENSYKSALGLDSLSGYKHLFLCIKNVQKYLDGQLPIDDIGVKAINESTLQVHLEHPKKDLPALLSFTPFQPSKKGAEGFLSSGPFILEKKIPKHKLLLKKNPFYHQKELIAMDVIEIKILDSETTAFQLFKNKELDLIGGPLCPIPKDTLNDLLPFFYQKMSGATLCAFNTQSPIFSNEKIRKAFAYSIDHESISKVLDEHKSLPRSFIPSRLIQAPIDNHFKYDPKLAINLLEEGLKELCIYKEQLQGLTYFISTKAEHIKVAQLLKEFWKTHLGIDVNLRALEHKIFASTIYNKKFDFAQLIWLAPYDSSLSLIERFLDKKGPKNFSSFEEKDLNSLIKNLEIKPQTEEIISFVEGVFNEQMPFIPLYEWQHAYLKSEKINKVCFTNVGTINFTYLKINKDS